MSASRKGLTGVAVLAALAGMSGVANGESITALGVSQVKVVAPAPLTNAKIVKAVAEARKIAIPQAIEAARNQATRIAIATGLQPGAILEVVETGPGPFGFYFGQGTFGRFGPNQYCGRVQKVTRGPAVTAGVARSSPGGSSRAATSRPRSACRSRSPTTRRRCPWPRHPPDNGGRPAGPANPLSHRRPARPADLTNPHTPAFS